MAAAATSPLSSPLSSAASSPPPSPSPITLKPPFNVIKDDWFADQRITILDSIVDVETPRKTIIVSCMCEKGHRWTAPVNEVYKKSCRMCKVLDIIQSNHGTTAIPYWEDYLYTDENFILMCSMGHRFMIAQSSPTAGCFACKALSHINEKTGGGAKGRITKNKLAKIAKSIDDAKSINDAKSIDDTKSNINDAKSEAVDSDDDVNGIDNGNDRDKGNDNCNSDVVSTIGTVSTASTVSTANTVGTASTIGATSAASAASTVGTANTCRIIATGTTICATRKTILSWQCYHCKMPFLASPEMLQNHRGAQKCPHAVKFGGPVANGVIAKNIIEAIYSTCFDGLGSQFGKRRPTAYHSELKLALHYEDTQNAKINDWVKEVCEHDNINLIYIRHHDRITPADLVREIVTKVSAFTYIPDIEFMVDEIMPGAFMTVPREPLAQTFAGRSDKLKRLQQQRLSEKHGYTVPPIEHAWRGPKLPYADRNTFVQHGMVDEKSTRSHHHSDDYGSNRKPTHNTSRYDNTSRYGGNIRNNNNNNIRGRGGTHAPVRISNWK